MQWVKWGKLYITTQRFSYWTYQRHSHFSIVSHAMSWSVLRSVLCQPPVSHNITNNRERWAEISKLCLDPKKYERMPQIERTWLHPLIILTSISPLLPNIKADAPCLNSTCGLRAQCHNFSSGSFICKCDRSGDYPFGTIQLTKLNI